MKIRTDFVTNSSSSSFTLIISFELEDGTLEFEAHGGTGETGRIDYFSSDSIVTVSPKQLGCAKNIDELIQLLTDGVVDDGYEETIKIFEKSNPQKSDYYKDEEFDAYGFIEAIRNEITDMNQIESITITGNESNYVSYNRTYTYNLKTKEYTGTQIGCDFEKDGSSGGDLQFSDLDQCDVKEKTEEDAMEDALEALKKLAELMEMLGISDDESDGEAED